MTDPFAAYEALLAKLEAERRKGPDGPDGGPRFAGASWRTWAVRIGLLLSAIVLPFYLLVGGAVLLYRGLGVPTWFSLLAAVTLTAALLAGYSLWVWHRWSGRLSSPRIPMRAALAVVGAYCIYSLVYVSSLNVKEDALRSQYRSLHPLLRLATSTFVLVDRDLVITDLSREPEDYARMGLPLYERSLHFVQEDGYAHAVDLRTIGRNEWRNLFVRAYFMALGFRTLRHVGTADHLHVSLPTH